MTSDNAGVPAASGDQWMYVNADVTTLDRDRPRARGIVAAGGTIVKLIDAKPTGVPKDVHVVDCKGAAIVPGFHDCHVHLTDTGLLTGDNDLGACATIDAILARIETIDGDAVFAGNYEEHRIAENRAPSIEELDAAGGGRPVLLSRIDGHSCVVNSAALALVGVAGMHGVERREDGKITGRLRGPANYAAQTAFLRGMPDASKREADRRAAGIALRAGITTAHNVIIGDPPLEALEEQYRRDAALPLRVISKSCTTSVPKVRRLGSRVFGGDIFLDGSIGSRTAAVDHGYRDRDGTGTLYLDRVQLTEVFDEAAEHGLSLGVHAIGDLAIEEAIASWEAVIAKRGPLRGIRPSIDHFEVAHSDQIARAARCGMLLSMQPAFDHLWGGSSGMYAQAFGPERALRMNLFKSAKRAGCVVCGGSDSPVTPFSALLGIQSLVEHHVPEERFTIDEALRAYAVDAARLSFDEGRRGTLAPGMDADFVVLEQALDTVTPARIAGIRVLATVIAGNARWMADGF
jgi:predicted amidohydrolase YtcJ